MSDNFYRFLAKVLLFMAATYLASAWLAEAIVSRINVGQ